MATSGLLLSLITVVERSNGQPIQGSYSRQNAGMNTRVHGLAEYYALIIGWPLSYFRTVEKTVLPTHNIHMSAFLTSIRQHIPVH